MNLPLPKSLARKSLYTGLALAATFSLTHCGSAKGAIDATNAMPDKIDATNSQVTESNKKIDETNGKMDVMVAQVKETNAQMNVMVEQVKATNAQMKTMVDQVKATNDGITKTNAAVHNQTLAVALTSMMSPENSKYLNPAPMAMLPPGQVFANEATSDEIVSLVFTLVQGIQNALPVTDPAAQASFNQDKDVDFNVAEVVAGLMSQAKVDEMVHNQIDLGGRYQDTAFKILALRYNFISSLNIKGDLIPDDAHGNPDISGLTNVGLITEAVKDVAAMTMIAKLPYPEKIGYKLTGFYGDGNKKFFDLSSDLNHVNILWKKLGKAIDKLNTSGLDANSPQVTGATALKAQINAQIASPVKLPAPPPVDNGNADGPPVDPSPAAPVAPN